MKSSMSPDEFYARWKRNHPGYEEEPALPGVPANDAADVAELGDAPPSKRGAARHAGSSPAVRTITIDEDHYFQLKARIEHQRIQIRRLDRLYNAAHGQLVKQGLLLRKPRAQPQDPDTWKDEPSPKEREAMEPETRPYVATAADLVKKLMKVVNAQSREIMALRRLASQRGAAGDT